MRKTISRIGERFGWLEVIAEGRRVTLPCRPKYWLCRCDCGVEKEVRYDHLRQGKVVSCSCRNEAMRKAGLHRTHGHAPVGNHSPTYRVWAGMKGRCASATSEYYGARGITVCDRWQVYENFLEDMGERPKGKSIDRINSDGNYEPGNCRWATPEVQATNQRPRKRG